MPIDYRRYPANWKSEIRPRILERAGHCCERCGVRNHAMIVRTTIGDVHRWEYADDLEAMNASYAMAMGFDGSEPEIRVVLTIAHLDHDITNNADANLAALCQRCHLNHDRSRAIEQRRARRAAERRAGSAQLELEIA